MDYLAFGSHSGVLIAGTEGAGTEAASVKICWIRRPVPRSDKSDVPANIGNQDDGCGCRYGMQSHLAKHPELVPGSPNFRLLSTDDLQLAQNLLGHLILQDTRETRLDGKIESEQKKRKH